MAEEGRTVAATAMDGPLENVASDDKFHSPANFPPAVTSSDIKTRLSAAAGTPVVAMSNAMATGDLADALVELDQHEDTGHTREQTESIEKCLEEDDQDGESKEKRKVRFKDDNLTSEFDDSNLWARDPNESAQDMITAYQRECLGMKVKPIQNLLDQLKGVYNLSTPIDTIDLTGVRLDNKVCESLEAVLSRVHAKTLKLERTNLEDEGMIAVCEMVEFYGCASRVLIAYNNRLRPRAWLTIGRTLKKSPFLEMIDVSYCALDEQTLTLLLRAVRANCSLRVLKIEGNNLTGKGTFILMAAMKFNENLQELYLARNHLAPEDGQHLGSILRANHTLRVLDVSDNNLQDAGIRYICAGIAEQQEGLHLFNLSTNNLTHEGVHHVSAMLPCTKTLRELNISNNRFGDNGLYMLKLGLLANRSVVKLSLSCTRITCEGAIALAEVLAESRYLIHVDLRENDIRVAGLMALRLAHRMNHSLLHLETPKTYKVEQRDRQLIRDLLQEIEQYRARNHKEKEERDKSEQRRVHEATHKLSGAKLDEEDQTVGAASGAQEEEEEEREVDPSLVGSLDNVLPEEQPGSLTDDPFKKAPVMDKESASSSEMEKTADALVVYSKEGDDCLSPTLVDVNGCESPREEQEDDCFPMPAATDFSESRPGEHIELDLLGSGNPHCAGVGDGRTQGDRGSTGSQDLLPDVVGASRQQQSSAAPPVSSPNHGERADFHPSSSSPLSRPPDITPQLSSLPPDLAANSQTPLDLLNPQAGMAPGLVDANEGVASDSSQTGSNFTRGTPDVAGQ